MIQELLRITDIIDLPKKIMEIILSNDRDDHYNNLLEKHNSDLSYDWFQNVYESELAQRNQNKQDFTPNVIGMLLSRLTGAPEGRIYEPTAGNGSLIIANWSHRITALGTGYDPNDHPIECWELSNRSIPILLFNLSIRGIVGDVYHGDVLTKEVYSHYQLSGNNKSKYSTIKQIQ